MIPLRHMYNEALEAQVPFLSEKAWAQDNKKDFDTSDTLKNLYNHYMSKAGSGGKSIGKMLNDHMAVYYAWRFAQIHRKQKGDQSEASRITGNEAQYKAEKQKADKEISALEDTERAARQTLALRAKQRIGYIQSQGYGNTKPAALKPYDDNIASAQEAHTKAQDALLSAKAKRDAMPSTGTLVKNLETYDAQLLADAKAIRDLCLAAPARRRELRPHYRGLLEAYENQFYLNKGLKDEKIFAFFENHIHDSLADFAKDSTLPSDPRVVYLGKDMKSRHAMIGNELSEAQG